MNFKCAGNLIAFFAFIGFSNAAASSLRGLSSSTLQYDDKIRLDNVYIQRLLTNVIKSGGNDTVATMVESPNYHAWTVHYVGNDWQNSHNDCVRYGDKIMLESKENPGDFLSGCRTSGNDEVHVRSDTGSAATTYQWIVRSKIPEDNNGSRDADTVTDIGTGSCVKYGDEIVLQNNYADNFWLTGGRQSGNKNVYTRNLFNSYEQTVLDTYKWILLEE